MWHFKNYQKKVIFLQILIFWLNANFSTHSRINSIKIKNLQKKNGSFKEKLNLILSPDSFKNLKQDLSFYLNFWRFSHIFTQFYPRFEFYLMTRRISKNHLSPPHHSTITISYKIFKKIKQRTSKLQITPIFIQRSPQIAKKSTIRIKFPRVHMLKSLSARNPSKNYSRKPGW